MPRKIFPLLLSEEERAEIEQKASANGLKLSEYVREIILDGKVTSKRKSNIPRSHQEIYAALSDISSNIDSLLSSINDKLEENQFLSAEMTLLRNLEEAIKKLRAKVISNDWKNH